ncbi:MAG: polysaccharide deacetylase family protein [Kiritimatiellae bacterium]|nr:polysaccharide deacetylase family protein [Kiritimatiellia bacterium]
MNKGIIWMLHLIESDSPRSNKCPLYRNLAVPPQKLEEFITASRERGYEFVSMKTFLEHKADDKEHKDIVITIDDGARNVYTEGFELFKRLNVPFVFYVATALIEKGFRDCPYAELDGMAILADKTIEKNGNFNRYFKTFKRIKRFLPFLNGPAIMRLMFGKGIDFDRYRRETICSVAELKEMSDSGLCEIGSHTHDHVHIDRVKNKDAELDESIKRIEEWTGKKCDSFSYPYGHVNDAALEKVRARFSSATKDVVYPPFIVTDESDNHKLPRVICTRDSDIDALAPRIDSLT